MAYNSMRCPDSDEVRSVIVALLVLENPSYGIPVSKLENNYFNEETERIPFRDLGFTSLIDYLKSLNFIRVYMNNGKYYLDFLGTEKSRHVSELIKNQKRVSRHSSQSRRNISSSYFPTGQSQIISQNSHRSRNVHPSARLSSKVSKEILSGVNDHPRESNKHQVNKSRGSRPKLDRDSPIFNEYLNSIDNSVNMVKNNTVVDSAKNSSNSKRLRENFGASTSSVRSQSPFERENTVSVFFDDDPEAIVFEESEWEIFSSTDEPSLSKKQDNCGPLIKSAKSNQIRKNTQSQENSVLKEHNHQEKKIPTESTTTKIVANSKPQKESSEETKENDDEDDSGFFVDSRTKFRLEKLIQNHPDGIWCAELPKKYKNEYKISLDWSGDFDSVSQFASNLPEIFRCVRLDNHGDFKLYDAKQPNVDVKGDKKLKPASLASTYQIYRDPTEKPSALGTLSVPPSDVKHFQEPDVIYLGETVGQIRISEFDEDGREYEEVLVVEAFSPSFFWIQLRRKTDIFEDMMSRLEAFYKINKDQYKIPLVAFEQGLNVACLFYEKWHRGVIKNVIHHPELSAQILFYDYGTVKTYPISELYQLQRSFGHLPAQAIPCGLYNVKPLKGDEWPVSTSREFVGRVFNIPLIACVGKLDYDNNSMLISLTDTSKADDVHINDWLIDKGFAQSGNMVRIRQKNFVFNFRFPLDGSRVSGSNSKLLSRIRKLHSRSKLNERRSKTDQTQQYVTSNINKSSSEISRWEKNETEITVGGCPLCPTCGSYLPPQNIPKVDSHDNRSIEEKIEKSPSVLSQNETSNEIVKIDSVKFPSGSFKFIHDGGVEIVEKSSISSEEPLQQNPVSSANIQTGVSSLLFAYDDEYDPSFGFLPFVNPHKGNVNENDIDWSVFRQNKDDNQDEKKKLNSKIIKQKALTPMDILKRVWDRNSKIPIVDEWLSDHFQSTYECGDVNLKGQFEDVIRPSQNEMTPMIREVLKNIRKDPIYNKITIPKNCDKTTATAEISNESKSQRTDRESVKTSKIEKIPEMYMKKKSPIKKKIEAPCMNKKCDSMDNIILEQNNNNNNIVEKADAKKTVRKINDMVREKCEKNYDSWSISELDSDDFSSAASTLSEASFLNDGNEKNNNIELVLNSTRQITDNGEKKSECSLVNNSIDTSEPVKISSSLEFPSSMEIDFNRKEQVEKDFDEISDVTNDTIGSSELDESNLDNNNSEKNEINHESCKDVAVIEKNSELTTVTSKYPDVIPVFDDLENESDGSEWDVHFTEAKLLNPPEECQNSEIEIEEVHSDDDSCIVQAQKDNPKNNLNVSSNLDETKLNYPPKGRSVSETSLDPNAKIENFVEEKFKSQSTLNNSNNSISNILLSPSDSKSSILSEVKKHGLRGRCSIPLSLNFDLDFQKKND